MKKILVSACLYGERCKYNCLDNTCFDGRFTKWKEEGRLVPVCPEVEGGLPVPRHPSERRDYMNGFERDTVYVETDDGRDVTYEYSLGAEKTVSAANDSGVAFCILKHRSPACGTSLIYDGTFSGKLVEGQGVAAEALMKAGYKCFSELDIDEAEKLLEKTE